MDLPVQDPPQGTHLHDNGLQFEENLDDVPQALEAARHAPPPGPPLATGTGQYPSVLNAPPVEHQPIGPDPNVPVNAAPQTLAPLVALNKDGTPAPPKRPRGRPRKIPGTENRGPAKPPGEGTTAGRGRPRGRPRGSRGRGGRGRGRGGKRKMSSDEDDFVGQGQSSESEPEVEGEKDAEGEDDGDDFAGPNAGTTKFGRKISKPKSFVPTNRPTIHRKKRQVTLPSFEANLMCETCRMGHSPPENRLVICETCLLGWHQLCSLPAIPPETVDSPNPWFCSACSAKLAALHQPLDLNDESKGWTTGAGEEKDIEEAMEVELPEGQVRPQREDEYEEKIKREWLESLPVKVLLEYVLSVEKKFAPLVNPTCASLPIWPPSLPQTLAAAAAQRAAEALEREQKLEREAEELAAAQGFFAASASASQVGTPTPGPSQSEVGTPLSFDIPGDVGGGARTAASRRAELAAAAMQGDQSASTSGGVNDFADLGGYGVAQQASHHHQQQQHPQHPHQHQQQNGNASLPPYLRAQLNPVSALSASPSPALNGGDIQVGPTMSTSSAARPPASTSVSTSSSYAAYSPQPSTSSSSTSTSASAAAAAAAAVAALQMSAFTHANAYSASGAPFAVGNSNSNASSSTNPAAVAAAGGGHVPGQGEEPNHFQTVGANYASQFAALGEWTNLGAEVGGEDEDGVQEAGGTQDGGRQGEGEGEGRA
ncbi:hypothetical protein JCM11641_001817 [Rhodosporidiobolus odoratus]